MCTYVKPLDQHRILYTHTSIRAGALCASDASSGKFVARLLQPCAGAARLGLRWQLFRMALLQLVLLQ